MGPFDLMGALQLAVLAIVALVLGLFVIRPLLTRANPAAALLAPGAALALPGPDGSAPFGIAGAGGAELGVLGVAAVAGDTATPGRTEIYDPAGRLITAEDDRPDPIERLRRLIEERQVESVEILRNWIEADPEEA